jgi:hypothetical protein
MEKIEKIQKDRQDYIVKEFENNTPEFTEYGKKFLAKKHHFMVLEAEHELVLLPDDVVVINQVFVNPELNLQITITGLDVGTFHYDPWGKKELALECKKVKFK